MQLPRVAIKASVLGAAFAMAALAVGQSVPDQRKPDALELLRNVEATYAAMSTYSAKSTHVMEMNGPNMQNRMEISTTIVADSSGRFRIESTGMMGMLMVSDGTTMWMYMPQLNQDSKFSSGQAQAAARSEGLADQSEDAVTVHPQGGMAMFGSSNPFYGYRSISSNVKETEILRSEKLRVSGSDVDRWVVSVEYESPAGQASEARSEQTARVPAFELASTKTLWVDKTATSSGGFGEQNDHARS